MSAPDVRYTKSGDVSIAYSIAGEGPFDLVFVGGWVLSSLEHAWDGPAGELFHRFASFSRLIVFDKRGIGLSDRVTNVPDLETRMDDVRAVMAAAGSSRAALMGVSEGGPMTALFAATYPDRTAAAVLYGSGASYTAKEDYPWSPTREESLQRYEELQRVWGTTPELDRLMNELMPSMADDEEAKEWWRRLLRTSVTPSGAAHLHRMNMDIDVRHVLESIRVPTLVLHRRDDPVRRLEEGRYVAARIPGAELVELEGRDHAPFVESAQIADEVEAFLLGIWEAGEWDVVETERVLATVLFTDIVGSTAKAAELGDRRWRDLLHEHHALVRRQLNRYRGRELDTAGDGFFASFDGPARAIRCACAITEGITQLGIQVRSGLHTGECEIVDGKVGGIAVHIGARVAGQAGPGEVVVSSTVRDIVAGSGIGFLDRGSTALAGVPGEWAVYTVRPETVTS